MILSVTTELADGQDGSANIGNRYVEEGEGPLTKADCDSVNATETEPSDERSSNVTLPTGKPAMATFNSVVPHADMTEGEREEIYMEGASAGKTGAG